MPIKDEIETGSQGSGVGEDMKRYKVDDQNGVVVAGSGENCICPHCLTVVPHKIGKACFDERCPKCGTPMQ
jgi:hypothetical protein